MNIISENVKLGYCYENSPIIWPDETPALPEDAGEFTPTARPGTRAPHAWIGDGCSTLDLFGDGFVLLCFGRNIDVSSLVAAAAVRRVPLKVVDIVIATSPRCMSANWFWSARTAMRLGATMQLQLMRSLLSTGSAAP
jgi:hypothetical protein